MISLHARSLPIHHNPALLPGMVALTEYLWGRGYPQRAYSRIVAYAGIDGTPTGCPGLRPEDEGPATESFVDALPDAPDDDPAWGNPSVFIDVESLLEPREAVAIGPENGDRSIPPGAILIPPELDDDACPRCGSDRIVRITPATPGPDGWGARCRCCGEAWNLDVPPMTDGPGAPEDLLAPVPESEAAGLVEDVFLFERPPAPISGGGPEPDDQGDDPMGFPRVKTAADRRQDMADVAEFYRLNPGA